MNARKAYRNRNRSPFFGHSEVFNIKLFPKVIFQLRVGKFGYATISIDNQSKLEIGHIDKLNHKTVTQQFLVYLVMES